MSERLGLVGAMPVGPRWRAQGHLGNGVKYLGTFDTEEEASAVFLRAKEQIETERMKEAEVEVDRILSSPTHVYQGGVGRGASLNGTRFKIIEAKDAHNVVAVPVLGDGTLAFDAQRVVLMAYLREETAPEPSQKAASITVDPTPFEQNPVNAPVASKDRVQLKEDILKFVSRQKGQDTHRALEFLESNSRGKLWHTIQHIKGGPEFSEQLEWLRANTNLPGDLLTEIENEALNGLFMSTDEQKATTRILKNAFGVDTPEARVPNFYNDED